MIWIGFITVAAVIILAGSRLSVLAEKLANLLNISSSTVGLLLVSVITSLPELSTSLGAVIEVGRPDLAVGNNLGSDLFNLMIIALCDLLFRKGGILRQTRHRITPLLHYLVMIIAILMTLTLPGSTAIFGMHFNIGSLLVIAIYLFIFFRTHRDGQSAETETPVSADRSELTKTVIQFTAAAVVIVIAGIILARLGDRIAERTGLEQSFVGSLFLALATSLPELTVSITAVRIGAFDLMLGNIFGSNMFNVLITAVADLVYGKEAFHIPLNISPGLLFIGGCSIAMTCTALVAMRQKKRARFIAWESLLMIAFYLLGLFTLYKTA
jgi:cation:H+ antiporter